MSSGSQTLSFRAIVAPLDSAFIFPKSGGMTATLDVDESNIRQAIRLETWRDDTIRVHVAIDPHYHPELVNPEPDEYDPSFQSDLDFTATIVYVARSGSGNGMRFRVYVDEADLFSAIELQLFCRLNLLLTLTLQPKPEPKLSDEAIDAEENPETADGSATQSAANGNPTGNHSRAIAAPTRATARRFTTSQRN